MIKSGYSSQFWTPHTCNNVKGCIFCTGPIVFNTNDTLVLWFGNNGCGIFKGLAGINPKLKIQETRSQLWFKQILNCLPNIIQTVSDRQGKMDLYMCLLNLQSGSTTRAPPAGAWRPYDIILYLFYIKNLQIRNEYLHIIIMHTTAIFQVLKQDLLCGNKSKFISFHSSSVCDDNI